MKNQQQSKTALFISRATTLVLGIAALLLSGCASTPPPSLTSNVAASKPVCVVVKLPGDDNGMNDGGTRGNVVYVGWPRSLYSVGVREEIRSHIDSVMQNLLLAKGYKVSDRGNLRELFKEDELKALSLDFTSTPTGSPAPGAGNAATTVTSMFVVTLTSLQEKWNGRAGDYTYDATLSIKQISTSGADKGNTLWTVVTSRGGGVMSSIRGSTGTLAGIAVGFVPGLKGTIGAIGGVAATAVNANVSATANANACTTVQKALAKIAKKIPNPDSR